MNEHILYVGRFECRYILDGGGCKFVMGEWGERR